MNKYTLLFRDMVFCSVILYVTLLFRSQLPLMAGMLITVMYLVITERFSLLYDLFMSFFIAFVWVFFARDFYHYGNDFIEIHGICLHSVFVWGMGLFAVSLLLSHFRSLFEGQLLKRTLIYALVCAFWIIVVEYSAYHIFNFRNQATASYAPVPVINCIHAPRWMQLMYFSLGPAYGVLTHFTALLSRSRQNEIQPEDSMEPAASE